MASRALKRLCQIGGAALVTVASSAVAAAPRGSHPRRPVRRARGSTVVHAIGGADAAPFYQEIGNRLLESGVTLNYQLVGGVRVMDALRRDSVSLVAAQTDAAAR